MPTAKPKKFAANQYDLGTTVAKALWKEARDTMDYINGSFPIGMMMLFDASRPGLPATTPDSRFWKYMDGSVISNAASPLNGITFPDMRNRFFRMPYAGESVGNVNGSDTTDLTHAHGGNTQFADSTGGPDRHGDGGRSGEQPNPDFHQHGINTASLVVTTVPTAYELQMYVRIL